MAGALINWVKLQNEYNCFWGIVDWHAMMSDYADPSKVKDNCRNPVDWLAVGVDPEVINIYPVARQAACRDTPCPFDDNLLDGLSAALLQRADT